MYLALHIVQQLRKMFNVLLVKDLRYFYTGFLMRNVFYIECCDVASCLFHLFKNVHSINTTGSNLDFYVKTCRFRLVIQIWLLR